MCGQIGQDTHILRLRKDDDILELLGLLEHLLLETRHTQAHQGSFYKVYPLLLKENYLNTIAFPLHEVILMHKTAPLFSLPDAQERQHALADYKGKWVILYFYPKDNTPGCTIEALEFTALAEPFDKENAIILGISPDSCASHQRFTEKKDLTVTLLADTDHAVAENYEAWGKKKFMGKEYLGVIRSTYLIDPEGKIVHHWPSVKAKGHAKEVLETLQEKKK